MTEHREAFLYEHYAPRLIEEADPCGAYLRTRIEQQFNEHFPRGVLTDAAGKGPALAPSRAANAGVGLNSRKPMEQV